MVRVEGAAAQDVGQCDGMVRDPNQLHHSLTIDPARIEKDKEIMEEMLAGRCDVTAPLARALSNHPPLKEMGEPD